MKIHDPLHNMWYACDVSARKKSVSDFHQIEKYVGSTCWVVQRASDEMKNDKNKLYSIVMADTATKMDGWMDAY